MVIHIKLEGVGKTRFYMRLRYQKLTYSVQWCAPYFPQNHIFAYNGPEHVGACFGSGNRNPKLANQTKKN